MCIYVNGREGQKTQKRNEEEVDEEEGGGGGGGYHKPASPSSKWKASKIPCILPSINFKKNVNHSIQTESCKKIKNLLENSLYIPCIFYFYSKIPCILPSINFKKICHPRYANRVVPDKQE